MQDAAQLRPFRFGGQSCTRLVTTRVPEVLPAGGPRVTVDAMSAGQSCALVADGVDGVDGLPAGLVGWPRRPGGGRCC